ncbi:MAG: hypothetical protein TE42_02025 [Candidatus Synechococcus spongiarum SP3]|uniref:Uncharacterized protein n=1 Tax=Candidatus Synechococcus spongiarum SP3 TaxID=1604020 RepID=A0A0G2HNE3_9SYNE|nr:MAG: hypothetical protein TE42_02025 [Candidatus Synechococcus spongiarum SP3]
MELFKGLIDTAGSRVNSAVHSPAAGHTPLLPESRQHNVWNGSDKAAMAVSMEDHGHHDGWSM